MQAFIILHTETVFEVGSQLFQLLLVAVEAEREHQSRGLDHIGVDVQVGADFEDGLQVAFVHERVVSGRDGDQRLVILDDIGGNALVVFTMAAIDERWLVVGVEERLHLQGYSLVLQRLDSFGVDDGRTIESQLNGLGVGDMWQLNRVGEAFRVGVEKPVHVFPDGDLLGIEAVAEDGCGEVGAFTPEGDAVFAIGGAADETLGQAYDTSNMLVVQLADSQTRLVPIGVGGAVVGLIFGNDIFACVEPTCRDVAFAEVFVDDAGLDKFAVAHGLVVLVVVGRVGLLQLLPKLDEETGDVLPEGGVGVVAE